jgi:hypothetical protein
MRKPRRIASLAACALLLVPCLANAATVSGPSGAVFVSQGQGFLPLTATGEFPPGAQVMVKPGGYAQIAYAGNCIVKVGSGLWTVQPAAPCANGVTEVDLATDRMNQSAQPLVTSNGGVAVVSTLVGVAVAGVIACVALCKNKGKPASP